VALDVAMRVLPARTADGAHVSMIGFLTEHMYAGTFWAGWLGYLAYAVALGALFGALPWRGELDERAGALWGGLYGVAWSVIAWMALVPALLETVPLSSAAVDATRGLALPLVIGHAVYGVILGVAFAVVARSLRGRRRPGAAKPVERRAA
jgi:hypothetical protein